MTDDIKHPWDQAGGPAFPSTDLANEVRYKGMSLRDWFAGMALASGRINITLSEHLAQEAYDIADAMLAERSKQTQRPATYDALSENLKAEAMRSKKTEGSA